MNLVHYEKPELGIIALRTAPLCISGGTGTEIVGSSGAAMNDSDFE